MSPAWAPLRQAKVVAGEIIAQIRDGGEPPTYDGHGTCYLQFGHDHVAKVDVTSRSGERPHGGLEGPSVVLAADKVDVGASGVSRWFGRS